MQKGRPRKTDEQKVIEGNFQKSKERKQAPKPPKLESLKPPEHIKQPIAKKAWTVLAKQLEDLGILTETDFIAFELLVMAYYRWRLANGRVKVTIKTAPSGYQYQNPMIAIESRYRKELMNHLARFGLDPSSRMTLEVPAMPGSGKISGDTKEANERETLLEQFF